MIKCNKSILAYSPLGRGVLTGKLKPGHTFAQGDHRAKLPAYSNGNIARINKFLEKLLPLAHDKYATISQLVIRWTIEQPGITIALVGARDANQAIQNAKASQIKLSEHELSYITDELNELQLIE
jgi:aryl-alcohol dehydrogenase-like predicted oxidoreductase